MSQNSLQLVVVKKKISGLPVFKLEKLYFITYSQVLLFRHAYTLHTHHAHDASFILNEAPFLSPLLLTYSVFL